MIRDLFKGLAPLLLRAVFDFRSHCPASCTVRKQFSPDLKLVSRHELFRPAHCFLWHPMLLQPQSFKPCFHTFPSSHSLLPSDSSLLPIQQSSRLVPRHLSEFALYLNFKSHSHLQDGELQRQSHEAGCFHTKQLKSFLWDESRI